MKAKMDPLSITNEPVKGILDAQSHVWNHIFSFLNSMALKSAIELGIPDAIQKHGKPITLSELANSLSLHPNKAPSLSRLMRLLVHSNFFSKRMLSNGEEEFDLTTNSQLLLKDHPCSLAPFAALVLDPTMIEPSYHFGSWFQNEDETPFHMSHGRSMYEYAACVPKFNKLFNEGMASDTRLVASLLVTDNEFKGLAKGVQSLVDVGGGNGDMAKAIAKLFPEVTCIVFDLPHVINELEPSLSSPLRNIKYVGGDMFEAIPPAQVVLLKWILHNWSDDHCIKILQRCKEAIPSKDEGGKVVIIDMVVEANIDNDNYVKSQCLLDMQMMNVTIGGKQRTEEEWKKLFISAGFKDYKSGHILGPRSVIEVYP